MRVIEWAFPYFPSIGGLERFVELITKELRNRKIDVVLIAQAPFGEIGFEEHYPEVDLRVSPAWELGAINSEARSEQWERINAAIGNNPGSVLHIHRLEGMNLLLLKRIRAKWKIPIVLTLHTPLLSPMESSASDFESMALVDHFVAISPFVFEKSLESNPELADRLSLISNAVAPREPSRQVGEGFLFMGRLSQEKGVLQLLAAFFFLRKLHPEVTLTIAGEGNQSSLLKNAAHSLGLASSVVFTGWLDQESLAEHVKNCRAVVIPTVNEEPFGLVAIEAMSQAKPIVYAVSGALDWIAEGDKAGLSFLSGDLAGLTNQMRQLHLDPELAISLGLAGHEIVQSRFRLEEMLDDYISVFKGLLDG
jgi:glycosyltransferase involved in cell wall biosynthesis